MSVCGGGEAALCGEPCREVVSLRDSGDAHDLAVHVLVPSSSLRGGLACMSRSTVEVHTQVGGVMSGLDVEAAVLHASGYVLGALCARAHDDALLGDVEALVLERIAGVGEDVDHAIA
eukprot:7493030-Pyramimonas_sp.AAC.1